jgi:riboflavin biosynthesis pyrimidine reductase
MARLEAEGLERILVEGGGQLGALFFADDLVDEIWLTQTPWLIGGDEAPSIADDAELFEPAPEYHLSAIESAAAPSGTGGSEPEETFLVYRKGARRESEW